jgi:heat-inducible transcriptional repressor
MSSPMMSPVILADRQREVFRHLVEAFLTSGEPVGSRTLSQILPISLSPASIRNVMADLETMGLLYAPHTSAGRVPTERGLRLFVDGLLQVGDLAAPERDDIEARLAGSGGGIEEMLTQATTMLSGLSRCAGMVVAAKQDSPLKHIEFVALAPGKAMVIMVSEDGQVENRLIDTPPGLPVSALAEADQLSLRAARGTHHRRRSRGILGELEGERAELDVLTAKIVAEGLATLSAPSEGDEKSADRARHQPLLESLEAQGDLDRIRNLFDDIERKNELIRLLELAREGDGVRIFIGSENRLFSLSGSSIVAAPYVNSKGKVVGVIGVLGPTRLNYARIIPMVDHTARVIGRLLG